MNFAEILQKLRADIPQIPQKSLGMPLSQALLDVIELMGKAFEELEGTASDATDLTTLREALETLEAKVAGIRSGTSEAEVLAIISDEIEPILAQIAALRVADDEQKARQTAEAERLNFEIETRKKEVAALQKLIEENGSTDQKRAADLAEFRADLIALETRVTKIEVNSGGISTEKVKELIAEALADFDQKWQQLRADLEAEKGKIITLDAMLEAAKMDIAGLKTTDTQLAANLKNSVDSLQNALDKLRFDLLDNKTGDTGQAVLIEKIQLEIVALGKRIDEILSGPNGLPKTEVERLIAIAVADFDLKIKNFRADFEAEKTSTVQLAAALSRFEKDIAALQKADADAAKNLEMIAAGLRASIEKVAADLVADQAREQAQNLALANLAALVNSIKIDLEKLKTNPPSGISEADVRRFIAEATTKTEAELAILTQKITNNTEVDQQRFDDLVKKIEAIKVGNVKIEDVKNLVLAALETWKTALETRITNLSRSLGEHSISIFDLQTLVKKLETKLENLSVGGSDEATVRRLFLELIAPIKADLQNQIDAFSPRFSKIETELAAALRAVAAFQNLESRIAQADATANSANAKAIEAASKADAFGSKLDAELVKFGLLKANFETEKAKITALEGRANGFDSKIFGFESELALFKTRLEKVEKILQTPPTDPEKGLSETTVRALIDKAILDFKIPLGLQIALVERRVDVLEALPARIVLIENRLDALPVGLSETQISLLIRLAIDAFSAGPFSIFQTQINQQLAGLSLVLIKNAVLADLEDWKKGIADGQKVLEKTHGDDQAALLLAFENLKKELAAAPPESWTKLIESFFEKWKTTVLEEVKILIKAEKGCCNQVAEHEKTLHCLQETVDKLPADSVGKAAIEKLVADAKAALLKKIDDEKTALDHRIDHLEAFEKGLEKLPTADLLAVAAFFKTHLSSFPDWKNEVDDALSKHHHAIEKLQNDLCELEKKVAASTSEGPEGDRLARLGLVGWGIVGGLEIRSDEDFRLHLTAGAGVLPNGKWFVEPRNRVFNFYKKWSPDPKDPFFSRQKKDKTSEQIEVWRLLEIDYGTPASGEESLVPRNERELDQPFSLDKVVLAQVAADGSPYYMMMRRDDFLRQIGQAALAKRLMGGPRRRSEFSDFVHGEDFSPLDELPEDDQLYGALDPALRLPELSLFRFGFRPKDECSAAELAAPNFPKIESLQNLFETWVPIIDDALGDLQKAIELTQNEYHALLFPQLTEPEAMQYFHETLRLLRGNWKGFQDFAKTAKGASVKPFVQYFYDWARDLMAAYHELRAGLQTLMHELFLGETLENRAAHLALGMAVRPNPQTYSTPMPELHFQNGLAAPLRDGFRQPPIYNLNAARFEAVRLHYRRVFELIESFYLPDFLPKARLPKCCCDEETAATKPDFSRIRITPSRSFVAHSLGEQAVPFYYPLANSAGSLHWFWDYRRTKTRTVDRILSYHAWAEGQLLEPKTGDLPAPESYTSLPEAIWPLFYSLDGVDFYRIEGHIDSKRVNPQIQILEMRQKFNLDFEVRTISVLTMTKSSGTPVFNQFLDEMLGAEHLAGVPRGGTFIIVLDEKNVAVADFAVPYRLGKNGQPIA